MHGITQTQFRSLNSMIASECTNIARWEGYVVCVRPKRFVDTVSPSLLLNTMPDTDYISKTSLFAGSSQADHHPEVSSAPSYSAFPQTPRKPLAPGSSSKCNMFVNGRAVTDPDIVAAFPGTKSWIRSLEAELTNSCDYVANKNGLLLKDFLKLNPSLKFEKFKDHKLAQCYLRGEYSYCVSEEGGPKLHLPKGWTRGRGLRWGDNDDELSQVIF